MKNLKILVSSAVIMIAATFILGGSSVHAQEQQSAGTYDYVASGGDNLSYVVRDSINRYCNDNGEDLNAAQRIYAETNTVNDMGAYWLDVNQDVHVSKAKLKDYIGSSKSLTPSQQAAWQKYADTTSIQAIIDGSKTNVQVNKQVQDAKDSGESNKDESKNEDDNSNSSSSDQDSEQQNESTSSDKGSWISRNWAKLILAGLIATLVYKAVSNSKSGNK